MNPKIIPNPPYSFKSHFFDKQKEKTYAFLTFLPNLSKERRLPLSKQYEGESIFTPTGGKIQRGSTTLEEQGDGKYRLTIHGLGEGEIQLQAGGYKNEPFAAKNILNGNPEIHRIEGMTERTGKRIKGGFKISRDGYQTYEGDFDVSS